MGDVTWREEVSGSRDARADSSEDMCGVLCRYPTALSPGAHLALVVGNVRYLGVGFPVDELLTEIAVGLGYEPVEIRTVRYRGNSAQQMGEYGREAAREACVVLVAPATSTQAALRGCPGHSLAGRTARHSPEVPAARGLLGRPARASASTGSPPRCVRKRRRRGSLTREPRGVSRRRTSADSRVRSLLR